MKKLNHKHGRLYAILKRDENGKLLGYYEHSFSMSWQPDAVRVWRESSFSNFTDKGYKKIEEWLPEGGFLVRLNSKNCPIKVVMPKGVGKMTKTYWRNQTFTVNEPS